MGGFFWKFTRSGRLSSTYVSLIIDVDHSCHDKANRNWNTSFEELDMVMLLLHDVEVLNQPKFGATKPAFKVVVQSLGYEPTLDYSQQRVNLGLVVGQSVMGRHGGARLDWGRYSSDVTPISLDVSDLQIGAYSRAVDGSGYGGEDKLSCYSAHSDFQAQGVFYDLMPKHIVMKPIITAMKQCDVLRTGRFVSNWLKWIPN